MTQTQEQKDIVEIKGEIGRIRHHQDLQKTVNEQNIKMLTEIKNALIGSEMNGHYGLVKDVDDLKTKQNNSDKVLESHKVYFRQMAWAIGVIVTTIISIIIALIKK